ncbi:hypothetical protein V502_05371, partial [Pseudogymnoascus sp. VKM F-4520 (FW-2644)]
TGAVSELLLLSCVAGAMLGWVQGGRERVSVEARCDTSGDSSHDRGDVMGPGARARRERAAGGDGVQAVAGAKASQVGVRAGDDECNGGFRISVEMEG